MILIAKAQWTPSEYDIKSSYSVSLNLSLNINCAEVDMCVRGQGLCHLVVEKE
jgi:hypothetical protein